LLQLVRYIHKNPVTAGLVEKSDLYQWSSHKGYISTAKKWDWLSCKFVFNILTPHKNQQIRKYKQFMAEDISEEINRVFDNQYLPSMLGSERFVQWVKKNFSDKSVIWKFLIQKSLRPILRQL
jgi:putative transposase